MPTINIFEAKTQLSRLIEAVETGAEQEIINARNGRPVARPVSIQAANLDSRIGVAKGQFVVPASIDEDNDAIAVTFSGPKA